MNRQLVPPRIFSAVTGFMVFVSVVLSVLQVNIVARLFGPRFARMAEMHHDILIGHPILRVFQNRLMGPELLRILQSVTHMSTVAAFTFSMCAMLALFYVVVSLLLEMLGYDPARRLLGMLSAFALTIPLMYNLWIYLWDPIDLIVMTIFITMLLANVRLRWVAVLILFEAINREVSILMAGSLVLIGFLRGLQKGWAAGRGHILTGGVLAVVTVAYTELVRSAMFVNHPEPGWDPNLLNKGKEHFGLLLSDNLHLLSQFLHGHDAFISFQWFLVVIFAGVIVAAWLKGGAWREVSVAFGVFWLATAVCGIVAEWRIWLMFVPFTIFFALDLTEKEAVSDVPRS